MFPPFLEASLLMAAVRCGEALSLKVQLLGSEAGDLLLVVRVVLQDLACFWRRK